MAMRRTRVACWITRNTDTHSDYVMFISFPLRKCSYESALTLRYKYIACIAVSDALIGYSGHRERMITTRFVYRRRIFMTVADTTQMAGK